jgi:phenylpyruvate tautomerase PptA (4-oxalocrotonate tautomerase family)
VAFRIPDGDRNQRLIEYDPADFESASDKGERFTIVTIDAFAGRSADAKRALYREMVSNLEQVGIPSSDVVVVIHDVPPQSWGVRGGKPASEVDLGYDIEV